MMFTASALWPIPAARHRAVIGAVTAALLLSACSGDSKDAAARQVPAPEVGVVTVHPQKVSITASVSGRVVAVQTAEIRPQVDGIVQERVFQEGSEVKTGDILYQIDPRSYQAKLAAAEAALKKTQAAVPSARAKAERYNNLGASSVVSKQDAEDAQATYLQAEADVAVSEADLETAQINLDYTTIKAPIDGQIGTSTVSSGSLVTAAQTNVLATIRQLDTVYVDLTESSGNLLKFRKELQEGAVRSVGSGQEKIEVKLELADGTPYSETGTIEAADRFVSETTSSFTFRSKFANPDRMLLPGMYVRATVRLGIDNNGFLLPQRGISRNSKGDAVALFIGADGKVETKTLTVLRDVGSNWLVTSGVADGDRLIVEGLQKVQDGQTPTVIDMTIDEAGNAKPVATKAEKAQPAAMADPSGAAPASAKPAAPQPAPTTPATTAE